MHSMCQHYFTPYLCEDDKFFAAPHARACFEYDILVLFIKLYSYTRLVQYYLKDSGFAFSASITLNGNGEFSTVVILLSLE